MATMYHVTELDRLAQIMRDGIEARYSDATTQADDRLDTKVVYVFASVEDAEQFGCDNYGNNEAAILAIDTDGCEMVDDPEYDHGVAYGLLCDVPPTWIVEVVNA